ncbi:hypothetical protein ECO2947_11390 [Escherichia coli]|nr:hypothetical protein ECO2947_11390 [Escherichia coli]
MENQEELQKEILTWAARAGQELVTIEICRAWFSQGRNDELRLHEFEDADGNVDWRAINNNRQKIFRWLRGETTAARRKTQVLYQCDESRATRRTAGTSGVAGRSRFAGNAGGKRRGGSD